MPKEKWLIDPAELDEFQRDILGLGMNDSYAIKGCAGSGKTILALYRANDIRIETIAEDENALPSFTLVVYTKALREFIRSGIIELGISIKQVIHWEKWDGDEVDHIIVDEAQDFSKGRIDVFNDSKVKSLMLYGDTQQKLYPGGMSIEDTALYLDIPQKELLKNYRLPKSIASIASYLCDDKQLEGKCVKTVIEKPRLKKFDSWQKELDFIINEISTRNLTDVAILVPFNIEKKAKSNNEYRNVETIKQYFDSVGFRHEVKMSEDESSAFELDFDSDNPKVMTFHSSKGLQFETIFIPFCDYPNHDNWFNKNFANPFYVAITRTYKNLYITHSKRLSLFLKDVPSNKFD
ncbi:ATP-binding domain-containing protein [Flavobacterium plurextorum]|uniref:3'-5' exonuclease n=1 Tax=Flavobacterium TaxID=237 RepID=UPI00214DBEDB|nr:MULTISPECIES: 3'-5' exonuclease [Flavobacterium]UUW08669.1 ATP-binding domain-containing protein [Flavobacterium plurextorum]